MVSAIDSNNVYFTSLCNRGGNFVDNLTRGFAAFHRRAEAYGAFQTDVSEDTTHASQIKLALTLYRRSKPERRKVIDDFMTEHADANGYRAAMLSLLWESDGTSPQAFDRLVLLYGAVGVFGGERSVENACSLLSTVPNAALSLQGEQLESYRAMVAVTAMCIFDEIGALSGYLTKVHGADTVIPPALHVWNGITMSLRPEYAKVVASHPEQVARLANAMRASKQNLSPEALEAVVTGQRAGELVVA